MSLDEFSSSFRHPGIEFRPELRWWLAEGLHTDQTLRDEVDTAHRMGFGGMEFLAMDEVAVDHSRYGWGSEEWWHDSEIVVDEATRRGMSVSFTSGTNWSNANLPTITPDDNAAAHELDVVIEEISPAGHRTGVVPQVDLTAESTPSLLPGHRGTVTKQSLAAVVAIRVVDAESTPRILDLPSTVVLTDAVRDGELDWAAPDEGNWLLLFYWLHGTGQLATPSVSENVTVNYLDRSGVDAVIDYWKTTVLTPQLRRHIAQNPRTQMYMDSLELSTYGAAGLFWSGSFADEFRRRRGYDIEPWLPFLNRSTAIMAVGTTYHFDAESEHREAVERVRFDYVRTLTDLYIENMLRPFAEFLHEYGIGLRSEISYGLPFELTRPGPEVDGIETESLEFGAQLDAYRLLAGPAHLFGKTYSSETGATTRNYIMDHRVYDQIIATQFAAGVVRTILHGWASRAGAESVTSWPGHEGMLPIFSDRFDARQPGSEFYPLWTEALARKQLFLRRGRPRIDVAILRTDHFTDNLIGFSLIDEQGHRIPDEDAIGTMWMRNRQNLWWRDLGMQDAGWTYDYFDPTLLLRDDVTVSDGVLQPDGPGYQAVIVYQDTLDPDAAARLLEFARQGLPILLVNGATENVFLLKGLSHTHEHVAARTPGLDGRDAELAATMTQLRQQPTVAEIAHPAQSLAALRALGVRGRAEFRAPNESVLTTLRDEGDVSYLYLYHFRYENADPCTVQVVVQKGGSVHKADPWTGKITPYRGVQQAEGDLLITASLRPGETLFLVIDHAASPVLSSVPGEREVARIENWHVTVESWDEGEPRIISEDRGLGYETREVEPSTLVTSIDVGPSELIPWREIPGVGPEVSGVGEYRSTFTVERYDPSVGCVLDLGSVSGGLGAVRVNESEPIGFDTSAPTVDVTDLLRSGVNTITVRVSSSLNNRLLARGYYFGIPDAITMLVGQEMDLLHTEPHAHGLLGPVRLIARDVL